MTILYREADAAAALTVADSAARRAGSRAMMRVRSAAPNSIQRAISSSERPQPMQWPRLGCITQTLLHGDSTLASALAMNDLSWNRAAP
jgi:hypothetical protein